MLQRFPTDKAIGESGQPLNEWSGIELPGMDISRIATLHCLLTGDPLWMALEIYEPVLADGNTLVFCLADN